MAQLFSYILPSSAMSPAPNDVCCSLCLPGEVSSAAAGAGVCAEGISARTLLSTHPLLSFGPWRHSWKDSPYSASSLSAMLAHATANSSLVFFSPIHNIFLVSLFIHHLLSLHFLCFFFFFFPLYSIYFLCLSTCSSQRSLRSPCCCGGEAAGSLLSPAWEDTSPNGVPTAAAPSPTKWTFILPN